MIRGGGGGVVAAAVVIAVIVIILLITSPHLYLKSCLQVEGRPYLRDGKYIVCILTVSFHTMQTWSINYQHIFFKLGQCLRILVITMPRQHYQLTREGT